MFTPPVATLPLRAAPSTRLLSAEFSVLVEPTQRETSEPVRVVQLRQGNGAFLHALLHDEYGAGLFLELIEEDRRVGGQAHDQVALIGPIPKRLG